MKCFIVFACFWAVVSAFSYSLEERPAPAPLPVVGLFSGIIQNLMAAKYAAAIQAVSDLQARNYQELINFLRANGGPGFNTCAKMQFAQRSSNQFWQSIDDITADLIWDLKLAFNAARATMLQQFGLVINQPLVRSWVRELCDLARNFRNSTLERIQVRRSQWDRLVEQTFADVQQLVQSELCQNPDGLQERFNRLVRISIEELAAIVKALENDIRVIQVNTIDRGFKAAHNIYALEIAALKYFVS